MDDQNMPIARKKKVVDSGKGVEKQGEALNIGPVNNMGNYQDRRKQAQQAPSGQRQAQQPSGARPASGQRPAQQFPSGQRQAQQPSGARPASGQRPSGSIFFGTGQSGARPSSGQAQSRPAQSRPAQTSQPAQHARPVHHTRPAQTSHATQQSSSGQKTWHSAAPQNGQPVRGGGGGGKLILIVIVVAVIFFGGRFLGLFGGGNNSSSTLQQAASTIGQTAGQVINQSSQIAGQSTQTGSNSLTGLLSSLLGSDSSPYDFGGLADLLPSMTGGSSSSSTSSSAGSQYFTSSLDGNSTIPDSTVSAGARDKFTVLKGNGKDTVTILVYMIGTDLESQNGMGTADLKEMANATLGKNVDLLVYTGGCKNWRNNVVSSSVNQIYRIHDGKMERLEENLGSPNMTSPSTLSGFIQYGAKNYSANRMGLILWDHGGGSVSGYGYDEKAGRGVSMTLAGINTALKDGGIKFDFIGFDACLMATVENGLMLSQYADYMIASEETEPGVGWYYTNWLTKLGKNPSMPTIEMGKMIADDFVEVCNQKCRGQATTLSVVDLAELQATVPAELKNFSVDTNELIQNKEYKTVSTARSKTREFAQSSKIDQIDLVHFAKNLGTDEGKNLAKALQGAVKYNRTGGGISNAYGLSIYFPYKKASKVSQMVSTYKAIGMDEEYTRCIQEFASLEVSGQISAGTQIQNYDSQSTALPGLMNTLLGGSSSGGSAYTGSGLGDLMGSLFGGSAFGGGSSVGGLAELFMGRSMTAEKAAEYILDNHFDAGNLVWVDGKITLSKDQWSLVQSLCLNVFYDDGTGFIDLGTDNVFTRDGYSLINDYDGTWISIDRQPVAYYYMSAIQEGEHYVISGYVPAMLNGVRVNLILIFDDAHPDGYIAGAQQVYTDGETEAQAKNMISIGQGDKLRFVCDFYDYDGNYRAGYYLGSEITLGAEVEIANTPIDKSKCKATYCFTDLYQQRYWTPVLP